MLSTLSQQLRHCSALNAPASCSCVLAPFARPLPSYIRQWSDNTWRGFSSQDTPGSNNAAVQNFLDVSGMMLLPVIDAGVVSILEHI